MMRLNHEDFGEYRIYRPNILIEQEVRTFIEGELFKEYDSKVYTQYDEINEIMKKLLRLYSEILEDNIKKVASRDFMEFILTQYDITCRINRSKNLSDKEQGKWNELGPILRRGLKFIAEKITMIDPREKPEIEDEAVIDSTISKVFIAAEEMARMYMQSDATYRVFKDETQLTLRKGNDTYWELKVNNEFIKQFPKYIQYDEILEDKQIDLNIKFINAELKEGFKEKFGKDLLEVLSIIRDVSNGCIDEIPFVKKEILIDVIKENYELDDNITNEILAGFSITKEKLIENNRQIFNPKQEYRALTRGFFEMSHETGKHLVWSKEMVNENLTLLLRGICYKKIPTEWTSKKITKNIETITNKVGTWFEKVVEKQLEEKLGIKGYSSIKNRIGVGRNAVSIPEIVGEIDFIGINLAKDELILGECKMISPAVEPRLFHDDISKFMDEGKGYVKQFNNKIAWFKENKDLIIECMLKSLNIELTEERKRNISIRNVLLTFYPSIVEAYIKDFEIYTLYEFIKKEI